MNKNSRLPLHVCRLGSPFQTIGITLRPFIKAKTLLLTIVGLTATGVGALGQGTAFTYHGRLSDGANPANGIYDLRFALYDALTDGAQQGNAVTNSGTSVNNGLFNVTLDFGNQFPGAYRWLDIAVRTNGGGAFAPLSPRQLITTTPYAIQAANAGAANAVTGPVAASQLTGTIAANNIAVGSITGTMLATGSVTAATLADNAVTLPKLRTLFDGELARTIKDPFNTNVLFLAFSGPAPEFGKGHQFGGSIAPLQSFLVVGSPGRDTYHMITFGCPLVCISGADYINEDGGAIYLFAPDGSPIMGASLGSGPGLPSGIEFGFSVGSTSTGKILAGAPGFDFAYIISTNGSVESGLVPVGSPHGANFRFGHAVAGLANGNVAVGAPGVLDYPGRVQIFYYPNYFGQEITPPAGTVGFGSALAAVGDSSLLVGAKNRAFLYSQSSPTATPQLVTTFNRPGQAVAALGGDKVIIGASLFSTNGTLLANFNDPFAATDSGFGFSVSAVGTNKIVIGAQSGRAFLFDTNAKLLGVFNNPTPGYAPSSLSSFGNQVAVGFREALPSGFGRGAVQVFNLDGPDFIPGLSAERGSITTASLADGAVTSAKIGGVLDTSQIPNLDASKIASGVMDATRIPALDASKISSGTLADEQLSTNVALRSGANTFTGNQNFTGAGAIITLDNMVDIYAKNSAGVVEGFLTGRWSDDATYFTYGTGGLFIRNNVSTPTMYINSSGNVGIGNFTPDKLLVVGTGGAFCNGTTWVNGSDRNAKEEFAPINPQEVLDKVSALPISAWRYKADGKGIRHLGPMAQDFYDAFKVGSDDKHIATVDADGVALAAIQGLNEKVKNETTALRAENAELKARLEKLERLLNEKSAQ